MILFRRFVLLGFIEIQEMNTIEGMEYKTDHRIWKRFKFLDFRLKRYVFSYFKMTILLSFTCLACKIGLQGKGNRKYSNQN